MKNNQSAAPAADVEGLTDEQIQEAATEAVRAGSLSWLGFERDSDGKFTVPVLSKCHFQFARAIEREVLATRPSVDLSGLTNHDIARVIFKHLRPSPFAEADWDRGAVLGAGNAVRSKFISAAKDVRALLATKAAEAVQPTGQPPIGRLMDEFSSLPFLWGLNEPGALVRHSDVFKMLVAAGKTYLAAPTLASAPQADEQSSMAGAPQERAAVPLVLTSEHRATLEQIAGWLNSSARIVQNGPDDYGLATQFDYELGQAAAEIGAILAAMPAAPVAQEGEQRSVQAGLFQQRVQPWMMACFGAEISADCAERNHRFFEEAAELTQACGMSASEAHQLVDYVWGRPVGEKYQEVGGVMVTLAALCLAQGLDMHQCGETELARIWAKVEQIRAKQAAKPKHSPLPITPAASSQSVDTPVLRERFKYMLWDEYTELVAHTESLIAVNGEKEYERGFIDGEAKTDVMRQKWNKAEADFKNFHRSLCERFGYTYDDAYWWRDQVSLEEHIATRVAGVRKDAERMDFLEVLAERNEDSMPNIRAYGKAFMGETLRDAIDAAMAAHSPATSSEES